MAAAVAGLIPVLHSVAGDKSGYYIGRQLWFGIIALYGVVVYVAHTHWVHIHEDFSCHGNITHPCLVECFEKSFNSAIIGTWYFFYFLFLAVFSLMELLMAQIRHIQVKAKSVELVAVEVEEGSMVGIEEQVTAPKKSILDFHREKMLLLLYLLYFLLQVGVQCVFLSILKYKHLPVVSQAIIPCSSDSCPGPYLCLIRESVEKRMSLYTLITLSCLIILFYLGFFIYSIHHYLLKGHLRSKF